MSTSFQSVWIVECGLANMRGKVVLLMVASVGGEDNRIALVSAGRCEYWFCGRRRG